jgi:hypothetical protein
MNNDILKHLLNTLLPYLIAFLLGVIVAWKGCGDTSGKPINTIIEKPVPVIEYVERWKEKPVRYVETKVVTVHDTVQVTVHDVRLDTLFLIDTLKIVEAWLTEVTKYDTTASFETADVRLRWQNYQNLTENLVIDYLAKKVPLKWALGVHANAGLISNFKTSYVPLMGIGLQATVNRNYYKLDYGFNGDHYVGIGFGRNIISR